MIVQTSEQGIVLRALAMAIVSTGLSEVTAEHVSSYTASFMPPAALGGRLPAMGTARTRRRLRQLRDDYGQLAVEVRRGRWAVHANGRKVLDAWRERERAQR